ncbi:MAG: Eco57I restriction-modification methylase domain-containing protein [Treponema sp.]|nr:Eco57I restriction-modification methylase domain-containing protein [Treponema sp.]
MAFLKDVEINRPNDCNGFDIVIGNPPYFKYEGTHKGEIDNLKKQKELKSAFGGKLNAYKLFLAKALSSLVADNGIICYIFQNSFLADQQATLLRKEVFKTSQIISIDSYPERDNSKKRVFESVKMSVCIPLIKKCKSNKTFTVNFWDDKQKTSGISTIFAEKDIASIDPEYYTIPRIKTEYIELLKKLKKLKTFPLKCYEGELNMTFHKSYFTQDKTKPKILKGASIQRFYYTEQMSQGEIEYLDEKKYLKDFSGEKSQHHNYERIAMQGMTGANDKIRIIMSLVPKGVYLANSCNYLLPTEEFPAKYLLALMNSKLINWYFRCFSTNSNVNGYEVESFPVPNASKSKKNVIVSFVDQILQAKENDLLIDTKDIEKQIDNEIYEIYGLSPSEIQIIEKQ